MALLKLDRLGVRERVGLAVAGLCAFVWLLDQFVIHRIAARFREVDAAIEQEKRDLLYSQRVVDAEPAVVRQFALLGGAFRTASSPSEAVDAMKSAIDDLARANGLSLVSVEQRKPETGPWYDEYWMDVKKFEAGTENLVKFLHAIWTAPGMLRVTKLSLAPGKEQGKIEGSMLITQVFVPKT